MIEVTSMRLHVVDNPAAIPGANWEKGRDVLREAAADTLLRVLGDDTVRRMHTAARLSELLQLGSMEEFRQERTNPQLRARTAGLEGQYRLQRTRVVSATAGSLPGVLAPDDVVGYAIASDVQWGDVTRRPWRRRQESWTAGPIWLQEVVVRPGYQRSGIGTVLAHTALGVDSLGGERPVLATAFKEDDAGRAFLAEAAGMTSRGSCELPASASGISLTVERFSGESVAATRAALDSHWQQGPGGAQSIDVGSLLASAHIY